MKLIEIKGEIKIEVNLIEFVGSHKMSKIY